MRNKNRGADIYWLLALSEMVKIERRSSNVPESLCDIPGQKFWDEYLHSIVSILKELRDISYKEIRKINSRGI